ncbi:MAG: amidase [Bacteroidetes bacterium]|nr:amidase [Bacteroidota bacterium]
MENKVSAFCDDALGKMDATALAAAIAEKKVSVQEVTEAAIARVEKVNPILDAVIFRTYEAARAANGLNSNGCFYGVPTFVKDNDFVKDTPTQKGSKTFKSKIYKKNSKYVNQFLSAGLNNLGKTTLPEFGFICSTEIEQINITRNPWNINHTTGGSSSGSAALVASGAVPIASANDGAGSTRIPASCCGLVGLKSTRKRVYYMQGTETLPLNIVYQGVLTRSVRDTAAFYAEAEKFYYNSKLPRIGHVKEPIKKRLRIAFFENFDEGAQGWMDADTFNSQLETAKLLESLGHQVEMIKVPINVEEMTYNYLTYYGFLAYMTVNFGRLTHGAKVDKSGIIDPFVLGLADTFAGRKMKLFGCIRSLIKTTRALEADFFGKYDIIMTSVTTKATPEIGYFSPQLSYDEISFRGADIATFLPLFNISGSPSISLPLGTSSKGLPIGVQFASAFGQDKLLLELALELEAAKPWKLICD